MTRLQRHPGGTAAIRNRARLRRIASLHSVAATSFAFGPGDTIASTGEFLARHCAECHTAAPDGNEPEGGVTLALPADDAGLLAQRSLWETALRRVEAGEMPPQDRPRPSPSDAEAFVKAIRKRFDEADLRAPPDPGRVTMRRLNRVEYRNTIRDLVGVDFDPTADFPSDEIGHGFDTIGDVLTLSPLLLERYLDAERAALRVVRQRIDLETEMSLMFVKLRWLAEGSSSPTPNAD